MSYVNTLLCLNRSVSGNIHVRLRILQNMTEEEQAGCTVCSCGLS